MKLPKLPFSKPRSDGLAINVSSAATSMISNKLYPTTRSNKRDLKRREYFICSNAVQIHVHFMYSLLLFLLKSETSKGFLKGLEKHFQVFTLGFLAFLLHISTLLPSNICPSSATGALGVPTKEMENEGQPRQPISNNSSFMLAKWILQPFQIVPTCPCSLKQIATICNS